MPLLSRLASLWRNLFRQARREEELTAELDAYLEMLIEQKIAKGLDPLAARRAALIELGGRDQIKEQVREVRIGHEVETLWQDLRYAARMLRRNPGFAAVAVLSLALGIGANTAIFSLIDAVLLKLLPVEQPEQLYLIQNVGPRNQTGTAPPYPCFEQFRERTQSFTGLAAFTTQKPKLRIDGQLEEVSGQFVSGNYFSLLGVRAALGRTLGSADDTVPGRGGPDGLVEVSGFTPRTVQDKVIRLHQVSPGHFQTFGIALKEGRGFTEADSENAPRVALFNEAAARFYFGDRSPLGAQAQFNARPGEPPPAYEIVGVVQDARAQNLRAPETQLIYLPTAQARDQLSSLTLAVRAEGLLSELTRAVSSELRAVGPDILLTNVATLSEQVDQSLLQERLVATLSLFFSLLALLLVCIGLYGVMAYGVARRTHELGIRLALGATTRDVLQLIIGQGMRLVALGLGLGVVMALLVSRWLTSLLFGVTATDPLTFGVIVLLLLIVALLACWLPARRASKVDPLIALRHD